MPAFLPLGYADFDAQLAGPLGAVAVDDSTTALGLHGYYYEQLGGDSGSSAILGDFKGDSYGIGPSFLWIPAAGGGTFSVSGTWLHDLDASNRLESYYVVVTLAW